MLNFALRPSIRSLRSPNAVKPTILSLCELYNVELLQFIGALMVMVPIS